MTQASPEQPKTKLIQFLNAVGKMLLRVDKKLDDWLEDYLERKRLYREQNPNAPKSFLISKFLPRPLDKLWDTLSKYTIYFIWFIAYRCTDPGSNGEYCSPRKNFKDYYISKRNYVGFTLFEMAVVLVIIGLLVGGLLAGRDLIRAADIRKVGTTIESFNTATNLFRLKYEALPGDMPTASSFGLGVDGNGNGNIYSGTAAPWNAPHSGVENSSFFGHLVAAGLIPNDRPCGNCVPSNAMYCLRSFGYNLPLKISLTTPLSCGSGVFIGLTYTGSMTTLSGNWNTPVYPSFANHMYFFTTTLSNSNNPSISPNLMSEIDTKFDDGLPNTGKIRAWSYWSTGETNGSFNDQVSVSPNFANCTITNGQPHIYNISNTDSNCPFAWGATF